MATASAFSNLELIAATTLAVALEATIFVLLALSTNEAQIIAKEPEAAKEVSIEVQPILDLPLLKKGSKKVKHKLPDMWRRKPPIKRYEAKSAPTPKAKDELLDKPIDTPLAKPDEEPPPPDAAIAKRVDEQIETDEKPEDLNLPEEGSADGVEEGTETDPLKAFAISQYKIKISNWFNVRFKRPTGDEIPCEELKKLRASVTANITGSRTVAGFQVTKPSGNSLFDARVNSTMQSIVSQGSELPPPPPNYPDILESNIHVGFFVPKCD